MRISLVYAAASFEGRRRRLIFSSGKEAFEPCLGAIPSVMLALRLRSKLGLGIGDREGDNPGELEPIVDSCPNDERRPSCSEDRRPGPYDSSCREERRPELALRTGEEPLKKFFLSLLDCCSSSFWNDGLVCGLKRRLGAQLRVSIELDARLSKLGASLSSLALVAIKTR